MKLFRSLFSKKPKLANEPDRSLKTDFHSHLIPAIDDGVQSREEAFEVIEDLYSQGVRRIITTPHIISDLYPNSHEKILAGAEELQADLKEKFPDLSFKAAAEYYLDEWFIDTYLKGNKNLLTLDEKHVLVETNYVDRPGFLEEVFFELKLKGYQVVFAHPERYHYLLRNFKEFEPIASTGILFQINMMSFTGQYGEQVYKAAEYLLEHDMIHALGSDIHKPQHAKQIRYLKRLPVYQKLMDLSLLNHQL